MPARRLVLLAWIGLSTGCVSPSFDSEYAAARRLLDAGRPEEAAPHFEAALEAARSRPAPAKQVAVALVELGDLYATYPDLGGEERAEPLLVEARRIADEAFEADSASRAYVLERLGSHYVVLERFADAREPLEESLRLTSELYGPERAYTTQTASNLELVYRKLGSSAQLAELQARREGRVSAAPAPAPAQAPTAAPASPVSPEAVKLEPNARDVDGAEAFVHLDADERPVLVAVPTPEITAQGSTPAETRDAAIAGLRAWERAVGRDVPAFRLEIVESAPDSHVQVRWDRRPRGFIPAQGGIAHEVRDGALRVRGVVALGTQPMPNPEYRLSPGELRAQTAHAFGYALGLRDCSRCDSILSLGWRAQGISDPTARDVASLEALLAKPNGTRVDGKPLAGLPGGALADVALASEGREDGVLADLPFLNVGREGPVLIDLARPEDPSFVVELDTGANDTVLTTDYARALGVSVRSVKSDPYRRPTVTGRTLTFWVMGQQVVGAGVGPSHFDYALLGGEFLRDFVVDVDYPRRRVRFLDRAHHKIGDVSGEQVVPLQVNGTHPYAEVRMGTGSVWALVDTGAEGPLMTTEEKARALGIAVDPRPRAPVTTTSSAPRSPWCRRSNARRSEASRFATWAFRSRSATSRASA